MIWTRKPLVVLSCIVVIFAVLSTNRVFPPLAETRSSVVGSRAVFRDNRPQSRSDSLAMSLEQLPDMVVSQPKPDKTEPFYIGQEVVWTVIVTNTGTADAATSTLGFYLGISQTDYFSKPLDFAPIPALGVGEAVTVRWPYTFEQSDGGEERYLNVRVDPQGELDELDNNNNSSSYGPFQVKPPSDLIVSDPVPGMPQPFGVGQTVVWSADVSNTGPGDAGRSYLGYYLGTSPTDFSNLVQTKLVVPLLVGTSSSEHAAYQFSESDTGTRYLNVRADLWNNVVESDENNNTESFGPFEVESRFTHTPTPTPTLTSTPTSTPTPNGGDKKTPTPAPTQTGTRTSTPTSAPVIKPWLFMMYLNGDNNLESSMMEAFDRLELAADNPAVDILVVFDGTTDGDSAYYHVKFDSDPDRWADYEEGVDKWSHWGELNMGDYNTLVEFIRWARERYPAYYSALFVVGHGNGWSVCEGPPTQPRGIEWDELSGEYICTAEMGIALDEVTSSGRDKIDVIFYDACLMAMFEEGYQISNYGSYFVASENQSFATWPYDEYIMAVTDTTKPRDVAVIVVDEYHESTEGYPSTMSVVDLRSAEQVKRALNELAIALKSYVQNIAHRDQVLYISYMTQTFDSSLDHILDANDAYIDLFRFAALLEQNLQIPVEIRQHAQSLQNAIDHYVVHEQHESGWYYRGRRPYAYWDLDNAHGVSIYFPPDEDPTIFDRYSRAGLHLTEDTEWDEFLDEVLPLAPTDQPTPTPVAGHDKPGPLPLPRRYRIFLPLIVDD